MTTKDKLMRIIKSEYVLIGGLAFHAAAAIFIWIATSSMFKTYDTFLIPIAGFTVSLDHVSMIYKLYNRIVDNTSLHNRSVIEK